MAQQEFEAAFREWRGSRPEHAALIVAVKREAPDTELTLLAARAGRSANDVIAIRGARRRALNLRPQAAQAAAAKKDFDRLEKEYLKLESDLSAAGTHGEVERLENELHMRGNALGAARRLAAETKQAAETVEAATKDGLI